MTGTEVEFLVDFLTPIELAADHYFFVPQVELAGSGNFLWLSAPSPIVPPGTPFAPDLQSWIRNETLAPDWLRVGTDIVGDSVTFNAAFSLTGATVPAIPEPGSLILLATGMVGLAAWRKRRGGRPDAS